tara:strand:+ start:918 stop:1877 length:960 start_codon:yes stop_codon:yes gene_type:complete
MDRKDYQQYFLEKELFEQAGQHPTLDFEDYYPEQPLEPYWDSQWYGGDNEHYFRQHEEQGWIGCTGMDYKLDHVVQDRVWTKDQVRYELDKHGLRQSLSRRDYASDVRVLHAGQCSTFGMGIPIEACHTNLTHGSHVNLSPFNSLMNMQEPIRHWVEEFNPTHIIISNPRFFTESDYMYLHLFEQNRHRNDAEYWRRALGAMYMEQNKNYTNLFLDWINSYGIPVLFAWEPSRLWRHLWIRRLKPRANITYLQEPFKWVVDLARDCRRPGIKSHYNIAQRMNTWIEKPNLGEYWDPDAFEYPHKSPSKYEIEQMCPTKP